MKKNAILEDISISPTLLLNKLFSTEHIAIAFMDRDFKFIRVNESYASADNREPDFFPGRNYFDLYPSEENEAIFRRVVESGKAFRERARPFINPNAAMRETSFWDCTIEPVKGASGKVAALILFLLDVTDRVKTENALRESEESFRQAFENANVGMAMEDLAGKLIRVNEKMTEIFGYSKQELEKMHVNSIAYPEDNDLSTKAIEEILAGKKNNVSFKKRFVHKDQGMVWAQVSTTLVRDSENQPRYFISVVRDITSQVQAETELLDSESRLRTLIEKNADAIIFLDSNGDMKFVNRAAEILFDQKREELVGKQFGFPISSGESTEINLIVPGNQRKIAEMRVVETRWKGEKSYVASMRDITRERQMEENLRQSQKLEAIGTLAGGIAHDFNNLLSSIIGFTDLVRESLPQGGENAKYLGYAYDAGIRAKNLVKQILAFSRQADQEYFPVNIEAVVKESLHFLGNTIPKTIEIRKNVGLSARIQADPTQVQQVILNLCTNAYHAMRETGGVLTISLKQTTLTTGQLEREPGSHMIPGKYVILSVEDTGHGIAPESLERIFDPYFTTKRKGEGTGLGLSVVHGIVKSHGGMITAESTPGRGSVFKVYFPRLEQSETEEEKAEDGKKGGQERILVVDDEDRIAELLGKILQRLGYKPTTFTDSLRALERFKSDPNAFDAVITDMTMPNMTGSQLAKKMLGINPDIPIVLCTGYSDMISKDKALELGVKDFLLKPMTSKIVSETLRRVLDKND